MKELSQNTPIYEPRQELKTFVASLLNEAEGCVREAERLTGIPRGNFKYAMKKDEFRQWYLNAQEEFLQSLTPLSHSELKKKIKSGNIEALRLFYQISGKIKQSTLIDQSTKINVNQARIMIIRPVDNGTKTDNSGTVPRPVLIQQG